LKRGEGEAINSKKERQINETCSKKFSTFHAWLALQAAAIGKAKKKKFTGYINEGVKICEHVFGKSVRYPVEPWFHYFQGGGGVGVGCYVWRGHYF